MLRSIGKQSGESAESVLQKKEIATMGRICRKMKVLKSEGDGWWEWEPMEEVPLVGLGECELERLVHGWRI